MQNQDKLIKQIQSNSQSRIMQKMEQEPEQSQMNLRIEQRRKNQSTQTTIDQESNYKCLQHLRHSILREKKQNQKSKRVNQRYKINTQQFLHQTLINYAKVLYLLFKIMDQFLIGQLMKIEQNTFYQMQTQSKQKYLGQISIWSLLQNGCFTMNTQFFYLIDRILPFKFISEYRFIETLNLQGRSLSQSSYGQSFETEQDLSTAQD
ncbi:unnamed protein product (macronuclear) [Paramecium tetraurelia]|uniref:Transmembrane protein n=1 Tax=Paramecium tetraurelia TaxID=5888 RepID=A0C3B3_PARTE|nr:uncharacterized protein GSPATT00034759001 [Paramecium tetraurelia]CAK65280.1 unnamed protein product [Paramecium tetraurelia]|eukprot:XP_001432677.1 hypothetical protein (macronuclear) [Paramecium tetraurelia strain d4-2]